ncbi:hypothetical protein, partial [Chryseobacterium sp. CH1]|uniref:hypothetical protein n=1 Tax=Chryseobacterium sp. CH1 TaxID=713551 RepID=UPI001025743D
PAVRVVPFGTANVAEFNVIVDVGAEATVPSNDTLPLLSKFSVNVLLPAVRVVPFGTANVAEFNVIVDVGAEATVPSNDT